MSGLRLELPTAERGREYAAFCAETHGYLHEDYIIHPPPEDCVREPLTANEAVVAEWVRAVVRDCEDRRDDAKYAEGVYVANTAYWAFDGGRMVAALNLRHRLTERLERYGGHWGVVVRPSERGRGIGRRLVREMLAESRRRGMDEVLLTVEANNAASRRMLAAAGIGEPSDTVVACVRGRSTAVCRYRVRTEARP